MIYLSSFPLFATAGNSSSHKMYIRAVCVCVLKCDCFINSPTFCFSQSKVSHGFLNYFILMLYNVHDKMLHWFSVPLPVSYLCFPGLALCVSGVSLATSDINEANNLLYKVLYFGSFISIGESPWSTFWAWAMLYLFIFDRISRLSFFPKWLHQFIFLPVTQKTVIHWMLYCSKQSARCLIFHFFFASLSVISNEFCYYGFWNFDMLENSTVSLFVLTCIYLS